MLEQVKALGFGKLRSARSLRVSQVAHSHKLDGSLFTEATARRRTRLEARCRDQKRAGAGEE